MNSMTPKELETFFRKYSKLDQTLGLKLDIQGPGEITYTLTIDERHLSSPKTAHGGILAAMMDDVLGVTALSMAVTKGFLVSTVEFKLNYLQPARLGDTLVGSALIDFQGKSLIVTSGSIKCGDQMICKGQGTFNLYPIEKNTFHGFEDQKA